MKKILAVLTTIAVVAFSSQAMAAWDWSTVQNGYDPHWQLVAFDGTNNAGELVTTGTEVHFNLGGSLLSGPVDTGIMLGDLGVGAWSEAYVGVFGSLSTYTDAYGTYEDFYFTSDTEDFTIQKVSYGSFVQGIGPNALPGDPLVSTYSDILSSGPYNTVMQVGNNYGTYTGLLGGNVGASDFGANVQLADTGFVTTGLYTGSMYTAYGIDPLVDLGDLYLYVQNDTLWISNADPVPVPGALVLLGSGLLGLFGIRRRNA